MVMEHAFTQVDIAGVEGLRDHTDGSALFKAGTCIGQYRITEAIGRGGFGTVWRAFDLANGRQVAIKVLRPEYVTQPDILARFKREARVAAMLEHENIAELYEIGKLPDGTPYIVMEYLFGDSLHVYLRSQGVLPPSSVGEVLRQLSSALSEAHAHGVVHRDIKSSNVMVCTKPDGGVRLVLLDFGIAKLLGCREPPITAPLTTIGSPHFMAPEQIYHNGVDARTDVYGLGVLAFELLTGKLPFQGHVSSVLCAHLEEKRPLPSNCDPTLLPFDPIIQRAMALDPAERYGSTDDFLLAFNRALRTHRGGPASCPATLLHTAAVGIYIQTELDLDRAVSCDAVQQAQAEDAAIDEIIAAIAHAARFLKKCGFISAYDYGNQSLFVLPLDEDDSHCAVTQQRRALSIAGELRGALSTALSNDSWASVNIHVAIGDVHLEGPHPAKVVGGSLLDVPPPPLSRDERLSLTLSPALRRATVVGMTG